VRSAVDDVSVLDHGDAVGQTQRRAPVGDEERRAPLEQPAQGGVDLLFDAGVDR